MWVLQDATQAQSKKQEQPKSEMVLNLCAAQAAAVRAITNMSYGEPVECQKEVFKALAKVLKAGSPAKKLAASQVVHHSLAHASGRSALCGLQIIPALVSLCATGTFQHIFYTDAENWGESNWYSHNACSPSLKV